MNQSLFLIVGGTHMSKSGSAVDQLAIAYSANSIGLLCLTFCFVEAPIWYFHHAIVDIFPNLFFSFQVQFPLLEISLALLILLTALFNFLRSIISSNSKCTCPCWSSCEQRFSAIVLSAYSSTCPS
jgi:hypothetical protein